MKKILALALALVMALSVMSIGIFAQPDTTQKRLMPQFWIQDTPSYANWVEAWGEGQTAPSVGLGETATLVWNDFTNFKSLTTTGSYQYGLQLLDMTLQQGAAEAGDTSTLAFTLSDMVIKADGYDDVVVPIAGDYNETLNVVMESWGPSNNAVYFNDKVTAAVSAVAGSTGDEIGAYFAAITEASLTITYTSYNGETSDGDAAPAEDNNEPADTTPEPDTTVDTTPEPATTPEPTTTTTTAPATGLALAVVPAVVALAAVAVSKKR